jgi:hypothetical protein
MIQLVESMASAYGVGPGDVYGRTS